MSAPELSLVICTLDEHESICGVLADAQAALAGVAHEIIVVDDSADERTADAVRRYAAVDQRVRLIRREGVRGLASAAIAGWDAAQGIVLGVMDGDGQHDPRLLRDLRDLLLTTQCDFAIASRYHPQSETSGLSGFRHQLSRAGTRLVHLALGSGATDPLSGLFLFRRAWFEQVRPRLSGVGFKILADLLTAGARRPSVSEAPTRLLARSGGVSKLDLRVIVELAAQIVQTRTRGAVPARFVLFGAVGATGVAVHLSALASATTLASLPFWAGQIVATFTAMTSNFFLNNLLTFRDQRLTGWAMLRGLLAFYGACAGGAVASEVLGSGLHALGLPALLAGLSGAAAAAAWNYWSASRLAWRRSRAVPETATLRPKAVSKPPAEGRRAA
jgi:dolichol-phosphate mannosyltransferase